METKENEEIYKDHASIYLDTGLIDRGRTKLAALLGDEKSSDLCKIYSKEIGDYMAESSDFVMGRSQHNSAYVLANRLSNLLAPQSRNQKNQHALINTAEKISKYAYDNPDKFLEFSKTRVEKSLRENKDGEVMSDFGYFYFTDSHDMSDFVEGRKGLSDVIHAYLNDRPKEFHTAVANSEIEFYYARHPLSRLRQALSGRKSMGAY